MQKIFIKARAKINLNLLITGKREDGYHDIKSVFQKINLYDEIFIEKIETNEIILETNVDEINNENNILFKAYFKLKERYKEISGIKVSLNKKIPMQAGMAGGSTDAASFIIGMNKLFDLKMTQDEMKIVGKEIGADVVPCLYNVPVKAEGIGDIVNKLNTNLKYYIIVIKPDISCDTKYMYQRIDMAKDLKQNDFTEKIIEGMQKNNLKLMISGMYNVFESVIEQKEKIENIKKDFIKSGAANSLMTGSGSCVYGIFETKIEAKKAYEILRKKYNEIYICNSFVSKNN